MHEQGLGMQQVGQFRGIEFYFSLFYYFINKDSDMLSCTHVHVTAL
jgi:hypothetical protein